MPPYPHEESTASVITMLSVTLVSDGEHVGDTVTPPMRKDEAGVVQFSMLAGGVDKVEVWARHSTAHNWFKIAFDNSTDGNEMFSVTLAPYMRAIVTTDGGATSTTVLATLMV